METLSVTVRYRPLRIGWCLRSEDKDALRAAMRLSFTLWGGRYNPIIPIDNFELAQSLVKLFRVDALWPVTDDGAITSFISRFPHLPDPFIEKRLFVERFAGGKTPILLDIYHPIHRLYQESFRNNPNPDMAAAIYTWDPADPLADVFLSTLGGLPSTDETGVDYAVLIRRELKASETSLANGANFPFDQKREWPVSAFCRAFMQRHHSVRNFWAHHGLYLGSADSFEDIVNFWNLKATDTQLLFVDCDYADRFISAQSLWFEVLRSRPQSRHPTDNTIAVWFTGSALPDVSSYGSGLIRCPVSPYLWNGLNIQAPYMYFGESRTLAAIGSRSSEPPVVSVQLPPKPFGEDSYSHDQHLVVSLDPLTDLFGNERATIRTPNIPELNEYYGRECYFEWNKARAEPQGLGIISSADSTDLSLNSLDVTDLVQRIFVIAGIKAEPSRPGRIAMRLIQQMGGIQGCRAFKIAGVRRLIETHTPQQTFTRGQATKTIWGVDTASPLSSYNNLYIQRRPFGSKLDSSDVFDYLLKQGVFRAGLRFDCPSCRLDFWTSIDDIRTEVSCEYCGHRFNVTPLLKDRGDWAFRRSGLFGREDHQEGSIPVVLTLQQLDTMFHDIIYTTSLSLTPTTAAISPCETDFAVILPDAFDGKINLVIAECKTREPITDDDVNNLKAVAAAFPTERFNVYVVLSKLEEFSSQEIERAKRLNDGDVRRAILLALRTWNLTASISVRAELLGRV